MVTDTAELVGHVLRDSGVRKRRALYVTAGVYIDVERALDVARFWADGAAVDPETLDAYVEEVGGQRLRRWLWRKPAYFFPEPVYRALRARG